MTAAAGGERPGGPPRVRPVPDVKAMGLTEAVTALEAAGAAPGEVLFTGPDDGGSDGWRVLSQRTHAGAVHLVVARAPRPPFPSEPS